MSLNIMMSLWMVMTLINLGISIEKKNVMAVGGWFVAALALLLQFLPKGMS